MELPVVRLAFTPDGAFIAGATSRSVLIWKVDSHSVPRAVWRPSRDEFESLKSNQDSEEEDEHCLCWDISGQKLAYGANSRVSIRNIEGGEFMWNVLTDISLSSLSLASVDRIHVYK